MHCCSEQQQSFDLYASAPLVSVLAISLLLYNFLYVDQRERRLRKYYIFIKQNYHGGDKKDIYG